MHIIVMPAWIAGTQVRKDAFGNIHVSLDCSVPCWNDAMEWKGSASTARTLPPYFQKNGARARSL